MIITKRLAMDLVKRGKAAQVGRTTDQSCWADRVYGETYVIVARYDVQRTDHYVDDDIDDVDDDA